MNIIKVIKEELNLLNQGVADKYAEKQFNIPDPNVQMNAKAISGMQPEDNMGELVGIMKENDNVNIYLNPKNLQEFDNDVKAVSTKDGDLFVAQLDGSFYHGDIANAINRFGKYKEFIHGTYEEDENVTWHRISNTNDFGFSVSYRGFGENINNWSIVEPMIEAVKRVNPNFNFIPRYWQLIKQQNYDDTHDINNGDLDNYSESDDEDNLSEVQDIISDEFQAWHGSPYDFDKFDTGKMGSGEGAQAFGWGLYFTDLESIANQYSKMKQNMLSIAQHILGTAYTRENVEELEKLTNPKLIELINKTYDENVEAITNRYATKNENFKNELIETQDKLRDRYVSLLQSTSPTKYNVTIHKGKTPNQYDWLLWDKLVMPEQIQKIVKTDPPQKLQSGAYTPDWNYYLKNNMNGQELYDGLSARFGSKKSASLFLLRAGIDGVKYPAESVARGMTSNTARGFNYVVFDPNAVTIEKKITNESLELNDYNNSILNELEYNLNEHLNIEGVADKYAEKEFHIEDPNRSKEQQSLTGLEQLPQDDKGELLGNTGGLVKTNVYANPKSLKDFQANVRAITDDKGNLFIAQSDGYFYHDVVAMTVNNSKGEYSKSLSDDTYDSFNDEVLLHRVGKTNMFGLSDSYEGFASMYPERVQDLLTMAQNKNPQFKFYPIYYKDYNFFGDKNNLKSTNINEIIGDELQNLNGTIKLYHGTPFKSNAQGIIKNGLQQQGDFKTAGGVGSESMQGRSYLSKELWNSVRYSFMQPNNQNWEKYIQQEPYGYLFMFELNQNELLPDEDAIGAGVGEYLNGKGNEFYAKYLQNIDNKMLSDVKKGSFKAYADIGKLIEPKLSQEDKNNVIKSSQTVTIDKSLTPTEIYQIPKPNTKFFKTKQEYEDYFRKYGKLYNNLNGDNNDYNEGVADKYAEKNFNIPDPNVQMNSKAIAGLEQDDSIGDIAGYITNYEYYEYSKDNEIIPIKVYVNPKNLNDFDGGVRAVSHDKDGNLFVAQSDNSFYHSDLANAVNGEGKYSIGRGYDVNENITWYRVANMNKFRYSGTFTMHMGSVNENKLLKALELVRLKNPNYEFVEDSVYQR